MPLRYGKESGIPLTAGLHMTFQPHGLSAFNALLGGQKIQINFPLNNLLNLEDRVNGDNVDVSLEINPSAIIIPVNKGVSEWSPISTQFREIHLSGGASVRWDEKQVLTRFRLRSNILPDGTSNPVLILEALVLPSGTWDAVDLPLKKKLSANGSMAIRLWSTNCRWYSSIPGKKLPTLPGVYRHSFETSLPDELSYRWYLQAILRRMDEGGEIPDRDSFLSYYASPFINKGNTYNITCWLPYPFIHVMDTATNEPGTSQTKVSSFTKNGRVIRRAQPVANQKFNSLRKSVGLSPSALPMDTPPHLRSLAGNLFNASIASSTAKNYATVYAHILKLEQELGRQLSWPLNGKEYNLILVYLINKGIQPATVRNYLSGTRRLSLAHGVMSPPQQTDLAKAIIKGHENLSRNPIKAVATSTHRPISVALLRVLGHTAFSRLKNDDFDQLCFWVTCLTAFWGSFRIGELLCEKPEEYSSVSDLLASDVLNMSDTSFALWIRDPKVPKKYGDVVELWATPQFSDIDPLSAFKSYWRQRRSKGFSMAQPLFMRANGKALTHSLFSDILKSLLAEHALSLDLTANKWTPHSFRSGLPTLLQSAGFGEEQIKAWGRWASAAYQVYAKDITKRFEVQRSMLKALDKLKDVTGNKNKN